MDPGAYPFILDSTVGKGGADGPVAQPSRVVACGGGVAGVWPEWRSSGRRLAVGGLGGGGDNGESCGTIGRVRGGRSWPHDEEERLWVMELSAPSFRGTTCCRNRMGRERRLRGSSPIMSFRGGAAKKLTAATFSSSWQ
jgi:hypothetical protein